MGQAGRGGTTGTPAPRSDVSSHLYSYSFKTYDWSRTHARQAELQGYLEEVIDDFGLRSHIRFGTTVDEAVWDESTHIYTVRLHDGEQVLAHVVVSALGLLNYPRYPDWPGLDDFQGPKFHTARWEHEHDLTGRRVAIVGTGSTATQIVPEIAPIVDHLYLFQREPGWVVPKGDRDFTPEERAALRSPLKHRRERIRLALLLERNQIGGAIHRPGTKMNSAPRSGISAAVSSSASLPIALISERPSHRNTRIPANGRSSTRRFMVPSSGTTWSWSPGPSHR